MSALSGLASEMTVVLILAAILVSIVFMLRFLIAISGGHGKAAHVGYMIRFRREHEPDAGGAARGPDGSYCWSSGRGIACRTSSGARQTALPRAEVREAKARSV